MNKFFSAKTKSFIGIVIGIIAILVAGPYLYEEIILPSTHPVFDYPEPPSAVLQIQGVEQKGYAWVGSWGVQVDNFEGIVQTSNKALVTASPFSATLRFTADEPPQSVYIQAIEASQLDMLGEESHGGESYFWKGGRIFMSNMRKSSLLTLTKDLDLKNEQTFTLELKRGLYVINVCANWKNGADVCYAFLIEVK